MISLGFLTSLYDNVIYNPNLFLLMIATLMLLTVIATLFFLIKVSPKISRYLFYVNKIVKGGGLKDMVINDFLQKIIKTLKLIRTKKILIFINLPGGLFKKLIVHSYDVRFLKILMLILTNLGLKFIKVNKIVNSSFLCIYINILYKKLFFLRKKLAVFIIRDPVFVLIILLLLTILTRFSISYTNPKGKLVIPEKVFHVRVGQDFNVGVVVPAKRMLNGQNIYQGFITNSGQAIILPFALLLLLFPRLNLCSISEKAGAISCQQQFAQIIITLVLIGYLIFLGIISRKKSGRTISILFLFFITFLLSVPGSFGLERVNIDIIFSLIIGFLLLMLTSFSNFLQASFLKKIFFSILLGVIAGLSFNSKMFLLPFSLIVIVSSPNIFVAAMFFVLSFVGISYSPAIFGAKTNIIDLFKNVDYWASYMSTSFSNPLFLKANHSFYAISSLFTNCFRKLTCVPSPQKDLYLDVIIISIISKILFIITFVFPFITTINIRKSNFNKIWCLSFRKKLLLLIDFILAIYSSRKNRRFILLLFILADGFINLIPQTAFVYRLYYSLPILLILVIETQKNSKARFYCYLSMIFLIIKGFWVLTEINPKAFSLIDPRTMSLFVIFHFYFLIKAGVINFVSNLHFNYKSLKIEKNVISE